MAIDPLWTRAPLLLRAHGGAAVAIAAAVVVLTVASTSAPLLVSSAGSAAFERLSRPGTPETTGLLAVGEGPAGDVGIDGVDTLLRDGIARLDQLSEPVASLAGMQFQRTPETSGAMVDGDVVTATLFHRDDLLTFVRDQPGSRGEGDGLWVPATLAEAAGVSPGDDLTLVGTSDDDGTALEVVAPVDGVYADPFDDGLLRPDAPDLWREVLAGVPRSEESTRVPPLLLAGRRTFLDHATALDDRVLARWESSLTATSLADARDLVGGLERFLDQATDPTGGMVATISAFARPGDFAFDTSVPRTVEQATDVAATLETPLRSLAVAAQGVALLLVAAAVAMLLRRRHLELRLLAAQGASPVETGLRVVLEVLPAAVVGAVVGWLVSAPVVRLLGPSAQIDPSQATMARGAVVTALAAALAVSAIVGCAVATTGGATSGVGAWTGRRLRWVPWEPVALALAVAAGYQLFVRADPGATGDGTVDLLIVAFPLLAVAALVGLAVRGLARLVTHVGTTSRPHGRSFATWLAIRRVVRMPAHALTLITAGGMALGLFVYFAALAASTGTSISAKSAALAGAETTSKLFTTWRIEPGLPRSMPDDTTFVWRDSAIVQPGDIRVDLMAVDPTTFADGAAWRPTFADRPLPGILAAADTTPTAGVSPVIAVGATADGLTLPSSGQLVSSGWGAVGFEVATRPEAFPGMHENIPLVVVDARRFFPLIGPYDPTDPQTQANPVRQVFKPEIWSAGPPARMERYLASRDTRLLDVTTRDTIAARADLLAPTWALGYLTALGTAVGCLALGALFVYAEQRRTARATSYALARRMGLSARDNVAATSAELLALLGTAFVIGTTAALVVGWAVAGRVDPAPRLPPSPQLELPLAALAVAATAVVVSALVTALWLQVRADRTDVAEVLRVAE